MTVDEYNRCVDSYSDNLYRYLLKNLGDEDTSKDLVQESYLKLWEKHKELDFAKSKSYLFTTAHHTMIDYLRKNKRMQVREIEEHETGINSRQYTDLKEVLNKAVERLPEDQRAVVLLRDYEGYNYKEISEITGLSETQVKVYIFRARTALRKYIVHPETVM